MDDKPYSLQAGRPFTQEDFSRAFDYIRNEAFASDEPAITALWTDVERLNGIVEHQKRQIEEKDRIIQRLRRTLEEIRYG